MLLSDSNNTMTSLIGNGPDKDKNLVPENFTWTHLYKMAQSAKRFVTYDEEGLSDFLETKQAKNTERSTKTALTLLETFCAETGLSIHLDNAYMMDNTLQRFYAGIRKANGDFYKVTTMNGIRFGLQRHFLNTLKIFDIINDSDFKASNTCFKNVLIKIKQSGKGNITHYPEIEPEDLRKLYASFDLNTPDGLQEKVLFDIMFFLCRRGRENLRAMTKSSFFVGHDATGKQYVYQVGSEVDKNHSVADAPFDTTGEGRIYETKSERCPVASFIKYLEHLHPIQTALWQRPRETVKTGDSIWYCSSPLGEKTLGAMMPKFWEKYGLSQRYTNHSIRVTSLQTMEDLNMEGRHIQRISGHKSIDSIKNYARRLSASRKRNISSSFATHLAPKLHSNDINKENIEQGTSDNQKLCAITKTNANLVDFNVGGDIDDSSLAKLSSDMFRSLNAFTNCNNCNFTFNVHVHK